MEPNIFRQIMLALVVATGLPYFVSMIVFQVTSLLIIVAVLAKLRAPEIAYKIVGAGVFFGLGAAVVATIGGWILFVLELVLAIPTLGILKGFAITKPRIESFSIDRYGQRHNISASQLYIGPGGHTPDTCAMSEALGNKVAEMAGYEPRKLQSPRK